MNNAWVKVKRLIKVVAYLSAIIILVIALLSLPYIFERLTAHDEQTTTIANIDKRTEEMLRQNTDLRVLEKRIDELERKIGDAGHRMTSK